MSGKDNSRSRKPKRKEITAMITEDSENGSGEEDNAQPANPEAQHQVTFPGAVPASTDKSAAVQDDPAAAQSLEVPAAKPKKSKSPIARVGEKIAAFLRRTPPKPQPETASPQKKVTTEKHWAREEWAVPSTSGVEEEEDTPMEVPQTPTGPVKQPDWTSPHLKTCPPELYGPMFDPFHGRMSGPVERIPLDPTKGAPPPEFVDPAPLARMEDICSPGGDSFEQQGSSGTSPSPQVTCAVGHSSDEPRPRTPTPPPRVPPPQPAVPPPEPEERPEEEGERRPRRKGEPRR